MNIQDAIAQIKKKDWIIKEMAKDLVPSGTTATTVDDIINFYEEMHEFKKGY